MENPAWKPGRAAKALSWAGSAAGIILLIASIWVFVRLFRRYDPVQALEHLAQIPIHRLGFAMLCAALSYASQTLYDYQAAVSMGLDVSLSEAALAAFIGNAFTNNIGLSLITGTSIRYRFYLAWSYGALKIAEFVALSKLDFFNGLLLFTGLTQILDPARLPDALPLHPPMRLLGALLIAPPAALMIWNWRAKGSHLKLGRYRLARPGKLALPGQTLTACVQFIFAAWTLYFLLPDTDLHVAGFGVLGFLAPFMAIKIASLCLPVPGNLGVFEGAAVAMLTPAMPAYPLLGALVAYRAIYYLMPLAIAMLALGIYEAASEKGFLSGLFQKKSQLHMALRRKVRDLGRTPYDRAQRTWNPR